MARLMPQEPWQRQEHLNGLDELEIRALEATNDLDIADAVRAMAISLLADGHLTMDDLKKMPVIHVRWPDDC